MSSAKNTSSKKQSKNTPSETTIKGNAATDSRSKSTSNKATEFGSK